MSDPIKRKPEKSARAGRFVEFRLSMSTPSLSQPSGTSPQALSSAPIEWVQPERQVAFHQWLDAQANAHGVLPATVRAASADASFRRYFRVDTANGSCIVMDAPPDKENCEPFVRIAGTGEARVQAALDAVLSVTH